jgi:hypothetical protein
VVRQRRLTTFDDLSGLLARARARTQDIVVKAGLAARARSPWETRSLPQPRTMVS